MQFGLFVPQGWQLDLVGIDAASHWPVIQSLASQADRSGWTSVWVFDHFHTVPEPLDEATHEAWTLMAAIAATTESVRLGQMCTCMGYRNPAYLAKVAVTVDVISGGRLDMGIGAGWYDHEWKAYGYGFPSAGERLAMLDEGVQIMRDLWSTGRASFRGEHYEIEGAICSPRPLQNGGIPLWVAGGGEKKTLRTAAKYARYTNFSPDPEVFTHKSKVLAAHCRDVGTDFNSITRSTGYDVVIGETEKDVKKRLDWISDHYRPLISPEKFTETDARIRAGTLVGTPEQIIDVLRNGETLGMTYALLYFPEAAYDHDGIDLFERAVMPAFQAG
jgi:F420-dependent oxidoreductase-like protein